MPDHRKSDVDSSNAGLTRNSNGMSVPGSVSGEIPRNSSLSSRERMLPSGFSALTLWVSDGG